MELCMCACVRVCVLACVNNPLYVAIWVVYYVLVCTYGLTHSEAIEVSTQPL